MNQSKQCTNIRKDNRMMWQIPTLQRHTHPLPFVFTIHVQRHLSTSVTHSFSSESITISTHFFMKLKDLHTIDHLRLILIHLVQKPQKYVESK